MFPRSLSSPFSLAATACLLVAGGARAELIKVSPFMPPQSAASAAPSQNAPLLYMGWIETSEGRLYRVVDPAKKTGTFLKPGEKDTNLDVTIKQHDEDRDTVTIEHGGQTLTLQQHESKVTSSGAVPQGIPPPPMPMPMPNVSPAVTQSVVVNPTPADEQRRLEAVAAEVARRRALREQAQQAQQAGQPVVAPPPPNAVRQDYQQLQQQQQNIGRQRGMRPNR